MSDLTGQRFGRLTCLGPAGKTAHRDALWLCRCDCGSETVAQGRHLTSGATRSCGCLQRESVASLLTTHGLSQDATGKSDRLYDVWRGMRQRCLNPRSQEYQNYGGRGIEVCPEWHTYLAFHDWALANGYREDLTIDRIDNNKGYEPGNCRWATHKEQARNRRNTVFLTYDGQTKALSAWAEERGINRRTLRDRVLHYGWPVEIALYQPPNNAGR